MGVNHSSAWEQPRPVERGQVAAAPPPFLAAGGGWRWRPCIRAFGDFWKFRGAAPHSIPGEEGREGERKRQLAVCARQSLRGGGACPGGLQLEVGGEVATVVGAPCCSMLASKEGPAF